MTDAVFRSANSYLKCSQTLLPVCLYKRPILSFKLQAVEEARSHRHILESVGNLKLHAKLGVEGELLDTVKGDLQFIDLPKLVSSK